MRKDFGLILAAAGRFNLSMPATAAASEINSAEAASGMEEDFSAVIRRMALSTLVEQAVPPAA
jgi:3-hydroxyisobutyrate dehydrogenase-like beta-hydroxyacid dehydrogenase